MKYSLKYEFGTLLIYVLPIFFGFSTFTFFISLLFVGGYLLLNKKLYIYFLLLFIYKYSSPDLLKVDRGLLNNITTVLSFYYLLLFFRNFRTLLNNSGVVPFFILGLFAFFSSSQSLIPALSVAKSLGFLVSGLGVFYVVYFYYEDVIYFMTNLFLFLVITSLIIPRNIGTYNSSLGLHSGILNQSQAYGWLITLTLPFFLIRAKMNKFSVFYIIALFGGLFYLFETHMRSAYISLFCMFLVLLFFDNLIKSLRPYLFVCSIIFIGFFLSVGRMGFIEKILDKRGGEVEGSNGIDEMISSRSQKAIPSLTNFYSNPIWGIGYGLPTESTNKSYDFKEHWGIRYFPGTNFIISFPVEKGVLYTAVLEELGLIGFLLFVNLIFRSIKLTDHRFFLLIPVLILSLGEASLFSLNGIGIFGFVVLVLCSGKFKYDWQLIMKI